MMALEPIDTEKEYKKGDTALGACDNCGVEAVPIYFVEVESHRPLRIYVDPETKGFWHCRLCYSTWSGNSFWYPEQYDGEVATMKTMVVLTHIVLKELQEVKDELRKLRGN